MNGEDWTTPAKNQRRCSSCIFFGMVGALESIIKIKERCADFNPDLSEQYLMSCVYAEYTAMGKPVLITNVGDATLFVKEYRCGIVIRNNNPENLREGFQAFRQLSEHELRVTGKNSRKLAEDEFDWDKILAQLNLTLTALVEAFHST